MPVPRNVSPPPPAAPQAAEPATLNLDELEKLAIQQAVDRYHGNSTLALAAYNAGGANVDKWVRRVGGAGNFDAGRDIPFPETRHYVLSVMSHRQAYRKTYPKELGLE